eukprot:COSAG01_NODE_14819_length_1406_cov_3.107881_1_plen_192_part_00
MASTIDKYADEFLLFRRLVDDCLLIWTGTEAAANQMINDLKAIQLPNGTNFAITFDISNHCGTFLDIDMTKGAGWRSTGVLDTTTHVKPINPHLHVPPFTCAPRHQIRGFVRGEFIRNLKRCSCMEAYYGRLVQFRDELLRRGYPVPFVNNLFETAPHFDRRGYFLSRSEPATNAAEPARCPPVPSGATIF